MGSRIWRLCAAIAILSLLRISSATAGDDMSHGVPTGHDYWAGMAFSVGTKTDDGRDRIYAVGAITDGTADNFKRFLDAHSELGPGSVVVFHSPGGIVTEGMAMGEVIRAKSFETTAAQRDFSAAADPNHPSPDTPGICASACSFAFLGGVARTVPAGSVYGVHDAFLERQPQKDEDLLDMGQRIAGDIALYLNKMGADPRLLTTLTRYNSNKGEMFIMPADQMAEMRVTTHPATLWSLRDTKWGFGLEGRNTALSNLPGNSERIVFTCAYNPRGVVVGGYYLPEAIIADAGHAKRMPPAQFVPLVQSYSLVVITTAGTKGAAPQISTFAIAPKDVLRSVRTDQTHFVVAWLRMPGAAVSALTTASLLSFKYNGQKASGGVTVDFARGRDQALQFFANCR